MSYQDTVKEIAAHLSEGWEIVYKGFGEFALRRPGITEHKARGTVYAGTLFLRREGAAFGKRLDAGWHVSTKGYSGFQRSLKAAIQKIKSATRDNPPRRRKKTNPGLRQYVIRFKVDGRPQRWVRYGKTMEGTFSAAKKAAEKEWPNAKFGAFTIYSDQTNPPRRKKTKKRR